MVKAYYPTSLQEALVILEMDQEATIYAGGTDIMVVKKATPSFLFLNEVSELRGMEEEEEFLSIGAMTTYTELLRESHTPEIFKKAIEHVAAPAIRNVATIGGNVCNASPAGDTLPVLYVLDARIEVARMVEGQTERLRIPIEEFIIGVKKTKLEKGSLVVRILLPKKNFYAREDCHYEKVGARKAQAISKLSFCALLVREKEIIKDLRIAFGAVGTTVLRSRELEKKYLALSCKEMLEAKKQLLEDYAALLCPIDDQRSSAKYRKQVCLNLLEYFIEARCKE